MDKVEQLFLAYKKPHDPDNKIRIRTTSSSNPQSGKGNSVNS